VVPGVIESVRLDVAALGGHDEPITDSNKLKEAGDFAGARMLLMELCQADLRCLDAHTHLGNPVFDRMLFVIEEVRSKKPWVDRS
jgi:hypothetical protein